MKLSPYLLALLCSSASLISVAYGADAAKPPANPTPGASSPADWRPLDPENMLYMELGSGRVIIELAPQLAPNHVKNIRALAREQYFDGLNITRVQDNFVTQWGPSDDKPKAIRSAAKTLPAEFTRPAKGLPFVQLQERDTFAPQVGFSDSFPVGRDPKTNTAWGLHCYGVIGVGRDNDADSGGGSELFVVIGHSPRQLDRNITVVGRVVRGVELLSSLPRGTAAMGFYEKPEQRVAIKQVRVGSDVPEADRVALEALKPETGRFAELIEQRRNRRDEWYKVPAGAIDVCNVQLPVRVRK